MSVMFARFPNGVWVLAKLVSVISDPIELVGKTLTPDSSGALGLYQQQKQVAH